ncbi:anaphase promoting complex subunit cdc16 [Boothiomyces macroporosus]|uniref:Anaphase promoting complex subunit cdc16 n=1 Tax=Boothiomyces macroporosus TaxID=261099 RepID=A0AAD5UJM4_9FUNG|nr:anaphase promoting complex subunit cdc16 [Boothiomyces macroporosus]
MTKVLKKAVKKKVKKLDVEQERDDPMDIYNLALIQYYSEKYLEGLQILKKLARSKWKSLLKCQLLNKLEKWDEIIEELESPVSSEFDDLMETSETSVDSLLWHLKGIAQQNKALKDAAKQSFIKALNIDPHCFQSFDSLLEGYLVTASEGEQIIHDLPLEKYTGTEAELLQSLYIAKLSKYGEKDVFVDAIDKIQKIGLSKCNLVALSKAEVYMVHYDFKPAYDILKEALQDCEHNMELLVPYIICLSQTMKINVLFVLVHELVDLFPKSCVSWFGVGVYYYHIGKYIEARRKTVQMNPHFGPGWIAFGHSFSLEGEYDSAISTYSSASKVLLGVHLPLMYIGMEHHQLENYALAQDFFNLAHEKCHTDPLLLNEMGVLEYTNEHYFTQVLSILESNQVSTMQWSATFCNLGHAYRKLENYKEARKHFLLVNGDVASLESAYVGLGLVCYFESNNQEAVEWVTKALSVNPKSKYCQDILDEIITELVNDTERPLSILPDSIWAIDIEQLKQKSKDQEIDVENLDDSDILSNPDEILFEYNISSNSDPFVDSSPPRTRKSPRRKKGVNVSPPSTGPRRGLLNFKPEQKTPPRKLRSRTSNPFEPSYSDDLSIEGEPIDDNIFGISETPDLDIDMDLDEGNSSPDY